METPLSSYHDHNIVIELSLSSYRYRVIVTEFIVVVVIELSLSSDHYGGIRMELPL